MIGKTVGSLNTVPAPSSAVLGESLKLLATFGDKKSIGPLLEQMRDVQAQNEQVFRDAQALMGDLIAERNALDESRKAFAVVKVEEDLANKRRSSDLSQAEARLSGKADKFTAERATALSSIDDKQEDLANREQSISSREAICAEKEGDLDSRLLVITRKEAALRDREQQLQQRENKLRAVLDGT